MNQLEPNAPESTQSHSIPDGNHLDGRTYQSYQRQRPVPVLYVKAILHGWHISPVDHTLSCMSEVFLNNGDLDAATAAAGNAEEAARTTIDYNETSECWEQIDRQQDAIDDYLEAHMEPEQIDAELIEIAEDRCLCYFTEATATHPPDELDPALIYAIAKANYIQDQAGRRLCQASVLQRQSNYAFPTHTTTKLSPADRVAIHSRRHQGTSVKALAEEYGVALGPIYHAIRYPT